MKYIYGPLKSRRLGLSLGISLTLPKTCNFDCLYCQLGKTGSRTNLRKQCVPIEEVFAEVKSWLGNNPAAAGTLDYITLSGSGEPTLNTGIGELIRKIKALTGVPVAVITNASLLSDAAVRQAVEAADLLVPSLDAVTPEVFARVNRAAPEIKIEDIIAGLVALRQEYKGKIWLEVMLVSGVNDDLRQIRKLKEVVDKINPDQIHLNSPVRSTAEPGVFPVARKKLEEIREILGGRAEII